MPDGENVAAIIDQWFHERIAGGAIAHDVAAYNQAYAALPYLKAALIPATDTPSASKAATAKASVATEK